MAVLALVVASATDIFVACETLEISSLGRSNKRGKNFDGNDMYLSNTCLDERVLVQLCN